MTLTRFQRPHGWTLTPLPRINTLRDEVDQLFDFAFGRLLSPQESRAQTLDAWTPALNLYDNQEAVVVEAELPGMKKENIQINLQNGFLTISGERKQEKNPGETGANRSERVLARFQRTVNLPSEVDADKIKAAYTNGILTVSLPKSEKAKPKQIPVSVN